MLRVLAVDCGASSIRVATVDLDAIPPALEIVYRQPHGPARAADGSLRWDWRAIVDAVVRGLEAGFAAGRVASIGIDTCGVDYGLLDADGQLVSTPYSYRDPRTDGWHDVAAHIGADEIYRSTGIQLLQINTIFQLAAQRRDELARARHLFMLPELLVHELTGTIAGERTSAGTTSLVDLASGGWSHDLLTSIGVDPSIMPPILETANGVGAWRGVPVHLVAGHDTASAFVAAPALDPATVIISSGTWMIVGVERDTADVSDAAMRANFSNEPAAFVGVRFLKNITGLWMFDQLRSTWRDVSVEGLLRAAADLPSGGPTVDATDARFLSPTDMEAEVRAAATLPSGAGREHVTRCVLDSLALAAADAVREITALVRPIREVVIVGGGSANWLLNQLIADATGLPVRTGPREATALGNALVQGIALGRWRDIDEARASIGAPTDEPIH